MATLARYQRGFGRRKPGPWARVNGSHPAAQSLAACWLLNEGDGPPQDISKNGYTGVLHGTLVPTVGNFGGPARHFDGSSAYFSPGAKPSLPGNMTLLAWLKTDAIGAHQAIAWDNISVISGQYCTRINTSGNFDFFFGGNGVGFVTGYTLTAGTWHQIAYTRSGSSGNWSCSFYFDGQASTDSPQTVTSNPPGIPSGVQIGTATNVSFYFQGSMDMVLLASRAWSATEIWQNYQDPFGFLQTPPPRRSFAHAAAVAAAALDEEGLVTYPLWSW